MNSVSPNKSVSIRETRPSQNGPQPNLLPFLQTVESFWKLVSKDRFPKLKVKNALDVWKHTCA